MCLRRQPHVGRADEPLYPLPDLWLQRQSRPSGMMGECDRLGSPWLRPSEGPASRGDVITGEIVWRLPMASMGVSSTSPPALLWQEMGLRDPGKGRGRSWHVQGDMGAPRSFWIRSHETADSNFHGDRTWLLERTLVLSKRTGSASR